MMLASRRHVVVVGAAISILLALGLVLAACTGRMPAPGVDEKATGPTAIDSGTTEPEAIEGTLHTSSRVQEIKVGPARRECYGPFRRMCLIVDGGFFYDEIDGFTHEPGYEYRLRIERYDAFPGQKEPPQDAGRYGYRLLEVLSKTPVTGEIIEATVAPARVTCPKSDELCLLVNGAPAWGAIAGFEFKAGYDHLIRYEQYADGSRRLLEILSQTPAQSTTEVITVASGRVSCRENAPITAACIVVNGEPYYGNIEDFSRRHGYEFTLRVEKYDLMPGVSALPPESSKYGYRLLEVLSEQPAPFPTPAN